MYGCEELRPQLLFLRGNLQEHLAVFLGKVKPCLSLFNHQFHGLLAHHLGFFHHYLLEVSGDASPDLTIHVPGRESIGKTGRPEVGMVFHQLQVADGHQASHADKLTVSQPSLQGHILVRRAQRQGRAAQGLHHYRRRPVTGNHLQTAQVIRDPYRDLGGMYQRRVRKPAAQVIKVTHIFLDIREFCPRLSPDLHGFNR